MRIFLSTVTAEFRDYRDQLSRDLTRHNVEVKVQEDFKDHGTDILNKLDDYIASCDAVVHLVGDMTGAMAEPISTQAILAKHPDLAERFPPLREALQARDAISYTQWEAWLALYHGKALFIAEAAPAAPRDPAYAPTDRSRASQRQHLERLRAMQRYPGATFANPDQLARQIAYTAILDRLAEERATTLAPRASAVPAGALVGGLAIMLGTPVLADQWAKTLGVALSGPLVLALAVALLATALAYSRYFGLLGAGDAPAGSPARRDYEAFRASLASGGSAAQLYTRWLSAFLDRVDRFFGDTGRKELSLWPRAFGLRSPAPLWTAAAFDRCLLLALLYPIVTIYVLWAVSGHVGPAEKVLGLAPNVPGWQRGAIVASIGLCAYCFNRLRRFKSHADIALWYVSFSGALAIAFAFGGAVAVAVGLAVATAVTGPGAGKGGGAVVVAGTVGFSVAVCVDAVAAALAGVFVVGGAVMFFSSISIRRGRLGVLLTLFVLCAISACLYAAFALNASPRWTLAGPLLLFLGVLTLLNTPFDWLSLGLTRALLRRGLELQGWWPLLLAVVDALLAGVVIVLLALTMVLSVQIFDALALHGGGTPVLPLRPLFDGIAANPGEPEYWWVYALLLSTLIPSLLNLTIGGTALLRGLPLVSSLLLRFMPAGAAVPLHDRTWMSFVLTLQMAIGTALGIAVQAAIAYLLLWHVMPTAGIGLLDLCRALADLDLSAKLIRFATRG